MPQVKGIYDGKRINALEEILLPLNTLVQVIVWQDSEDQKDQYRRRLVESGLLNENGAFVARFCKSGGDLQNRPTFTKERR